MELETRAPPGPGQSPPAAAAAAHTARAARALPGGGTARARAYLATPLLLVYRRIDDSISRARAPTSPCRATLEPRAPLAFSLAYYILPNDRARVCKCVWQREREGACHGCCCRRCCWHSSSPPVDTGLLPADSSGNRELIVRLPGISAAGDHNGDLCPALPRRACSQRGAAVAAAAAERERESPALCSRTRCCSPSLSLCLSCQVCAPESRELATAVSPPATYRHRLAGESDPRAAAGECLCNYVIPAAPGRPVAAPPRR